MSLKGVHVVFIAAAALLAAFLGTWCLRAYLRHDGLGTLLAAAASFAASLGLVAYGSWFLRKARSL